MYKIGFLALHKREKQVKTLICNKIAVRNRMCFLQCVNLVYRHIWNELKLRVAIVYADSLRSSLGLFVSVEVQVASLS